MKRVSSVLIVFLLFWGSAFAQTLEILTTDGTPVTGDTVVINIQYPYEELSEHFWIVNKDTQDYDVQILFNVLQLVAGTGYSYCWDNCYANPRDGHISGPITIAALDTNTNDFVVDYSPDGNAGITMFRFSFFADGLADTAVFTIKFVLEQTRTESESGRIAICSAPGRGRIILNLPAAGSYDITVTSLPGKTILKKHTVSSGTVLNLSPGIYILKVSGNNLSAVRRIIVY